MYSQIVPILSLLLQAAGVIRSWRGPEAAEPSGRSQRREARRRVNKPLRLAVLTFVPLPWIIGAFGGWVAALGSTSIVIVFGLAVATAPALAGLGLGLTYQCWLQYSYELRPENQRSAEHHRVSDRAQAGPLMLGGLYAVGATVAATSMAALISATGQLRPTPLGVAMANFVVRHDALAWGSAMVSVITLGVLTRQLVNAMRFVNPYVFKDAPA